MYPMDLESKLISFTRQVISLLSTMDLDLQRKPESELISLTTQIVSVLRSMDMDSQPKPLSNLISLISQKTISAKDSTDSDSDSEPDTSLEFMSLVAETLSLEPEPELLSLIHQIFCLVISLNSKWKKLISLCPQVQVCMLAGDKFRVIEEGFVASNNHKWSCLPLNWDTYGFTGEETTHFLCRGCNGHKHAEYNKAPVKVKHILHPLHFLQLVLWTSNLETRRCYCCHENLMEIFYYCAACDFAMNIACVEKQPIFTMDQKRWHEHTLFLLPGQTSLTCNRCALADSSSPIYMCPPCDFVVHLRCINLPRVIKISGHPHRLSFTASFDQGDWFCGVCTRKVDNDYGGYSCIKDKDGCSYVAHSKCATQRNVWDGLELEEEPEDDDEDFEAFVRVDDETIQHFSHREHFLRFDDNTGREYDDNMLCQACITPINFGKLYACMECDFILHERCANLSRRILAPIHPHNLTLVTEIAAGKKFSDICSACPSMLTGFFYACRECRFKLHVQCATISEPLCHKSHMHPLFLRSKSGEQRVCSVCKESRGAYSQTFNCNECHFDLCFACATLPQNVRYTDDKHILTLFYGEETSTTTNWCEECEGKICKGERFYMCDEDCCVTLHIECMLGSDLYMKPGSSWFLHGEKIDVLHNNLQMSRPICSYCAKRCRQKIFYQCFGLILCSISCMWRVVSTGEQIA